MQSTNDSTNVYDTIREAASHGDLEAIKRMHKAGHTWDQNATSEAAANGHLDCLIFLHKSRLSMGLSHTCICSK